MTVPPFGEKEVKVTITPNSGLADGSLYGGYLLVTSLTDNAVTRVPYVGYKGDYHANHTGGVPGTSSKTDNQWLRDHTTVKK